MRSEQEAIEAADMRDLDSFNRQAVAYQAEAYTLAWHLLGDEDAAGAALQAALVNVYRAHPDTATSIRTSLLREIIHLSPWPLGHGADGLAGRVRRLPRRARQALLLVDLLGLSYEEAAAVMDCSRSTLAARLARARKRLASVALAPLGRSRPYAES